MLVYQYLIEKYRNKLHRDGLREGYKEGYAEGLEEGREEEQ